MSTVLPGHSIPYAYTDAEIQTFLTLHNTDPVLAGYIQGRLPPYGIIVNEAYGQILVWFDASGVLHVVDVTNLSIAQEVAKAPYESPDSGVIQGLLDSLDKFIKGLPSPSALVNMSLIWLALVGGFIIYSYASYKKPGLD